MEFSAADFSRFSSRLMAGHWSYKRILPWINVGNPYLVWLSEIILQQTRVAQGLPYFLKFSTAFPTVKQLADASSDEVMRHWEGLGYYSRARNLHETAKYIAYDLKGVFPQTYDEIRRLKGVGDYTAAAIASFAFGLPYPVLDGNVYRVLARYFGIETPIDTNEGKKMFAVLAQNVFDKTQPAQFNQAIMDFGAEVCSPKMPACTTCCLKENCKALANGRVETLPIKSKVLIRKTRYFNYIVLKTIMKTYKASDLVLLNKRTQKDIWQGLYDFPMIESTSSLTDKKTVSEWLSNQNIIGEKGAVIQYVSKIYTQKLTHQDITAQFWVITINEMPPALPQNVIAIAPQEMGNYACPKIVNDFWADMTKETTQGEQMNLDFL